MTLDDHLKQDLAEDFAAAQHFFNHQHTWLHNICFITGLIAVIYFIVKVSWAINKEILAPSLFQRVATEPWHFKARYGRRSFAIVTAGSDGIGRAFCLQLARLGFRVIVISRSVSNLEKVCLEIDEAAIEAHRSREDVFFPEEKKENSDDQQQKQEAMKSRFARTGFYISFDFSTATSSDYQNLFEQIDQIVENNTIQFVQPKPTSNEQHSYEEPTTPEFKIKGANSISILVNNVGINYDHWDYFIDHSAEENVKMLKVNCEPQLRMTHHFYRSIFMPRLFDLGFSCGIVDLASMSGQIPIPLGAVYAGTKAMNASFNRSLALEHLGELKEDHFRVWFSRHVDFVSVFPGFVATGMTHTDKPTWQIATPENVAKNALNQMVLAQGRTTTQGAQAHLPMAIAIQFVPSFLLEWFMLRQNKECLAKGWVAPGVEDRSKLVHQKKGGDHTQVV